MNWQYLVVQINGGFGGVMMMILAEEGHYMVIDTILALNKPRKRKKDSEREREGVIIRSPSVLIMSIS